MARIRIFIGCVLLVSLCGGCTVDQAAKKLVTRERGTAIAMFLSRSSPEQLKAKGTIDEHKTYEGTDGVPIDVWVIKARDADNKPAKKARATMLILHGLHQHKGDYLGIGQRLGKKGYDVILADLRGHGDSGGEHLTYGVKDKTDLKLVVDALIREKLVAPDIFVFGVNFGAAAAIHYASIDTRCKGVFAIAPYAGLREIARHWYSMMSEKDFEKVLVKAGDIAGIEVAATSTVAAAGKLKCPIVISQGLLDLSVPREQVMAIHKAAPQPKKLLVPGPQHLVIDLIAWEDWIADRMDDLATKGVK